MLPSKPAASSSDVQDNSRSTNFTNLPEAYDEPPVILNTLQRSKSQQGKFVERVGLTTSTSTSPVHSPAASVKKHPSTITTSPNTAFGSEGSSCSYFSSSLASPRLQSSSPREGSPGMRPAVGPGFLKAFQRNSRGSKDSLTGSFSGSFSGSFQSSSPLHTPSSSSKKAPFPFFRDDVDQKLLGLRKVQYTPYDPNAEQEEYDAEAFNYEESSESAEYSAKSSKPFATYDGSADPEQVANLSNDFLDRMYRDSTIHGTLLSFRLQQPDAKPNRRQSFELPGIGVIASPKAPPTSTKTNPYNCIAAGHIPYTSEFLLAPYILTDNNIPGAFPEELTETPSDIDLLVKYRKHISDRIQEVKMFHELVCFSDSVQQYRSETLADGKKFFILEEHKYITKHFIQECRALDSILELIDQGNCIFMRAAEGFVYFRAHNIDCVIDLHKLMPVCKDLDVNMVNSLDSFKSFAEILNDVAVITSSAIAFHTPIFYLKDDEMLPLMVHAGQNGFHVTGDADPYVNSTRADLPHLHKTFNGGKDDPECFLTGLFILLSRITNKTFRKYFIDMRRLKSKLDSDAESSQEIVRDTAKKILRAYAHIFDFADSDYAHKKYWFDYGAIEYYNKHFIPAVVTVYDYYRKNPSKLKTVGQSSVFDLLTHFIFDHPLYVHGTEAAHPGSKPEDFSAIILAYAGEIVIAEDPRSFIAYVWSKPELFATQQISIHPYWLLDQSAINNAEGWFDILAVQSLYAALKGRDKEHSAYEFDMYWKIFQQDQTLGRTTEKDAFIKIGKHIEELRNTLISHDYNKEDINRYIERYYLKYTDLVAQVKDILYPDPTPRSSCTPG